MTQALRREGKPLTTDAMREVGEYYTSQFKTDLAALRILPATAYPKASDHIAEDIALVATLGEKGFTYKTSDGIYFDTEKFPRYAEFARLDIKGMQAGVRIDVGEKKHPTDFAIWKFNETLGYDAPFGKGFPGWHIECSAMAMRYLGETIDIHTGGVDHIPVHHTNEIAQSECATGKPYARFWMHNAHILVDGEKMSKSLGNTYRLIDIHERGIPPLAYRYWLLTAHYRTQANFTWEALAGAQSAYNRLTNFVFTLPNTESDAPIESYISEFTEEINDDLNTANAIALVWKLMKDASITDADKYATLMKMDKVLGLGLALIHSHMSEMRDAVPAGVNSLLTLRQAARSEKNFAESDRLRDTIKKLGYDVKDTPDGQMLEKI